MIMNRFKLWLSEQVSGVFYHGTNKKFNTFSMAFTAGQMGIHFGNIEQAMSFINDEYDKPMPGTRLIAANLLVNNPLQLEDHGSWYGEQAKNMVSQALGIKIVGSGKDSELRRYIIQAGYDSIVYQNTIEGDGLSYIIFDPNQIKVIDIKDF